MTVPALESLLLRDFRSISGEWEIPLNANVVLIHGPNGAGKTSLLSALELAATGGVSYLDRLGDDGYRRHLNHRGTKSGQVTLRTSGLVDRNLGSASLNLSGAECQPLLDTRLAETFVERCFLPQATLGRLFEVYAPRDDRTADTPLIRFVKEVLGLDALDALIDGLYTAGDVRRVQKLSRGWQAADNRHDALQQGLREALTTRSAAQLRVDTLTADLVAGLGGNASAEDAEQVEIAINDLVASRGEQDADAARLREAALRLDAVESTLVQENLISVDPNEPEDDHGLGAAEERFQEWRASRAEALTQWFSARPDGSADSEIEPDPAAMLRALRLRIGDVDSALTEVRQKRSAIEELNERSAVGRATIAGIERDLAALAETRGEATSGSVAANLAAVLASVLEHVDGEVCPVCDQDFRGSGSLRDHVLAKANGLSADAARLVSLEGRWASLEAERSELARELTQLDAQRVRLGDVKALDSEAQHLAAQLSQLKVLEPIAEAGQLLATEVARAHDLQSAASRSRTLLDRCLADLREISRILAVEPPRGLLAQQVAALRARAQSDLDEVSSDQQRIADLVRLHTDLKTALEQLHEAERSVVQAQTDIARLEPRIAEARRRKEVASRLRRAAEELRTATTTRVFDERLNGSWARIFGALVPSEPFVPQFKPIPAGTRRVTVDIETIHRDGVEGATPAAMLSQGNLNTAALSLFIALHFAVPAQLPWLVFDDPVQSMDDLHVSNFAALVKQLSRRNGRQVIVAVHERELFEYLALELTPASPGEEVLTVLLDRTYGRTVVRHDRLRFHEDTALDPSPAA